MPFTPPPPGGGAARPGSARQLQQALHMPQLDLPPIAEFLPPIDSTNLMPLDVFLNKTGLPSWDELGLPPLSALMRPVGTPQSIFSHMPSRAEIAQMANDTMNQVLQELLPPELKALASVQLPKLQSAAFEKLLPQLKKLPELPADMPKLADLLKALPPLDSSNLPNIPGLSKLNLKGLKLPPAGEVMKAVEAAGQLVGNNKPANLPSLQEVLNIVNTIGQSLGQTVVAPEPGGASATAAPAGASA